MAKPLGISTTWSRAVSFNRPGWRVRRGTGREAGPAVEFIQQPRAYVVQEFARGKEIDQIFGDLEESYRRVKALRKSWNAGARSIQKRNRQRLAAHSRRLKR